jgi:murein DD-endopeptidase MepM/ murein hydrolase activator NlpD
MATAEIIARLKLNAQHFTSELQRELGGAERRFGQTGQVIGRNISEGIGGGLQEAAARVPVVGSALSGLSGAALVGAAGVGAMVAMLGKGISEAETLAASVRQLDAATQNFNNTGLSRGDLLAFSEELEDRFAIAQEEIVKVQAELATFEGVAGTTFKNVMVAAADLSATFNTDLSSEAIKLGTVIQNLTNGDVEGLRKALKFLGTANLEAIEKLAKTGQEAEAVRRLFAELKETTGDAADARGKGVSGAMFRLADAVFDTTREFTVQSGIHSAVEKGLNDIAAAAKLTADQMKEMNELEATGTMLLWLMEGATGLVNPSAGVVGDLRRRAAAEGAKGGNLFDPMDPAERQELLDRIKAESDAMRAASDRKAGADRRRAEENAKKGVLLLPPVSGPVTSGFGPRVRPRSGASAFHPGIDYGVASGTPVRAGAAGVVVRTGTMRGLGNVVVIDYGNNIEAQFSHLSAALVKPGDIVARGQVVARSGNTGISTGPHLDYRVKEGGSYVDPRDRRFKIGDGVGNAYASFEERSAREREQADEKAARELEARRKQQEQILKTMRAQLDVDVDSVRYVDLRARGLGRLAALEEELDSIRRRGAEQLADLPDRQAELSAEIEAQARFYEEQGAALARLIQAHGDRATLTKAEAEAEAAASQAMVDALADAVSLTATAADRLRIEEAIARVKHQINGAVDDATKAEEEAKALREEALEQEAKLRKEAFDAHRDQVQDLADFYERAMRSGGKSIVEDFKDQMISSIADIAAQWTLALLSGQKVSFGSLLENMGATTGGGAQSGPMGFLSSLFGGGGGIAGAAQRAPGGGIGGGKPGGMWDGMANAMGGAGPAGGAAGEMAGMMGSIGSAMPYVGAAMAAGQMMNKILGIKDPTGGLLGPLGALFVNSFIPAKRGSATLGFDPYGELGVGSSRGNSASRIDAAKGGIGSVAEALQRVAEGLGGELTGRPSVSLGLRDGSWRGDPTGRGITKTKNGAIDFGEDQEAAVRWAIGEALKDGVVSGISDAAKRILASGQDLERAIDKAAMIVDIPRRLAAQLDPVGAALEAFHKGWEKQIAALKEGGATAEEMADAHRLYRLELEEVKSSTREASAGLKDFLADLNFGSASPYSLRDQERMAREALQPFLDRIGSGERIDQEKYQAAARSFLDIERELYGSTGDFFKSMDMIQAATGKAIADIDNAKPIRTFADPFIEKTAASTAATANIADDMNQRLANLEGLMGELLAVARGSNGAGFIGGGAGFLARSARS